MKHYTAAGKQVLRQGEHFADAVDATAAQIIADALNDRTDTDGVVQREALRALNTDCADHFDGALIFGTKQVNPAFATGIDYAREPDKMVYTLCDGLNRRPSHTWQRQQDEYACSCGMRWPVEDGDDHPS